MLTHAPKVAPWIAGLALSGVALHVVVVSAVQSPLSSSDPRPLADVVRQIENRFDWIVTYEDPPYENASEMMDVAATVRKENKDKPLMVPRGGLFVFDVPAGGMRPLPGSALPALLDQYHRTRLPGRFAVKHSGLRWHIVPIEALTIDGTFRPYTSLLDARVEFAAAARNGLEAIEALVQAVQVRGRRLHFGSADMRALLRARVVVGANGESARDVLSRILDGMAARLSWQLLCSPGQGRSCALSIHQVRPE